ncbi:MAG: hypothetical protein HC824_04575 [Synechococcales cyanobacterium RM1_1_8]|nr:hypothetical protein [Synechococcales cyanobacterium RM1_1_8]
MSSSDQTRVLRATIVSLQTGLLNVLEFLEILAEQSSNPELFKRQIDAIRVSLQLIDELPSLEEAGEPDRAGEPRTAVDPDGEGEGS